tara:strand:- start:268 stop:804 length:537 start_codon:yes stop_codon:yes gene_type:complete
LAQKLKMKRVLVYCFFSFFFITCSQESNKYNFNLNNFKCLVNDINIYFSDTTQYSIEISEYFTDDFVYHSFPAGHKKGIDTYKDDYIETINQIKKMGIIINVVHSIYLPGIDEHTYNLDGSVRVYYGADILVDSNLTNYSGYQTVNFRDGKVSELWEWADFGGISNHLKVYNKPNINE